LERGFDTVLREVAEEGVAGAKRKKSEGDARFCSGVGEDAVEDFVNGAVAADRDEAMRVLSQVKRVVRTNYSNPPTHGGQIVATVLDSPQLRSLWERELGGMRERIKEMRKKLVDQIHARVPGADFSFVLKQRGMFSYSGLTKEQVRQLRAEFSIYAIDTGRICVAALNTKNVDYVADAIANAIR